MKPPQGHLLRVTVIPLKPLRLMPRKLDWRELAFAVNEDSGNGLLDSRKTARVAKANTSACSICTSCTRHTTKYQLMQCKSQACHDACPPVKCGWRGKVLTCSVTRRMSLFETGKHLTEVVSPRKAGLSRKHKQYCKELTALRMKPVRVRNGLRAKFGLDGATYPRLRVVQNFVNYYSKTQLGCNDNYDGIVKAVRDMAYTDSDDDSAPISFTYGKTSEGELIVGDHSDSEPFIVGITSGALLKCLDRDPETFIFHLDATFKLSQVGYPVLVLGIPPRARTFHLVAFIILSQRIESVYTMALMAFRASYAEVTGKQVRLKYVMGDAEDSQSNALEQVFRFDSDFTFLICFFHVMKKVQERTKSLPDRVANGVLAQVYNMHFCATYDELVRVTGVYVQQWSNHNELSGFAAYFSTQWLNRRYSRWQCCYVRPGFATTNNRVEQFNRVIKRDYTLRARLKMGLLIKVLSECCTNESARTSAFKLLPEATAPLMRRTKQLASDKLLELGPCTQDSPNRDRVRVQSRPAQRFYIPAKKRAEEYLAVTAQMGRNYARMEHQGQPPEGWLVDVSAGWCQCRYWRKFGCCIHLLYSRIVSQRVNGQGNASS